MVQLLPTLVEDGYEASDTTWNTVPSSIYVGSSSPYHAAYHFDPVNLPASFSTIDAPTEIDVDVSGVTGAPTGIDAFGYDEDDVTDIDSTNRPSQQATVGPAADRLTTASTACSSAPGTGSEVIDLQGQVNEIGSRSGWASGQGMAFTLFEDGTSGASNYWTIDANTTPAVLEINYDSAGGGSASGAIRRRRG